MDRSQRFARVAFAIGFIGLGVLALIYHDFALDWQPVPAGIPGRIALAYASGVLMLVCGGGLLATRTASVASRILFVYLVLWVLLLKVWPVIVHPLVESNWLGLGEVVVLLCGGWVLFAELAPRRTESTASPPGGGRGIQVAKILFGLALIPIGLSHLVYAKVTMSLVPAWLPFRTGWAYFTGIAHIAAGLGVLLSIVPRLAATLEAAMIGVFTLLVWGPQLLAAPTARNPWTAFIISWTIAAGAWVVAESMDRQGVPGEAHVRNESSVRVAGTQKVGNVDP